jgi:uncharacterized membrane protein
MKRWSWMAVLVLIASCVGINIWAYGMLPEVMASHWGINGEVNGYMSRDFMMWFMPVLMVLLVVMFAILPKIDPKKHRVVESFYWQAFVLSVVGFLGYVNALVIWWNIAGGFDMARLIIPGLAVIFYISGKMMEGIEQNYFVGFRTPWALENKTVWDKTNRAGSLMMKISALGILALSILGAYWAFWGVMILVLGGSLVVTGYSYLVYRNEKK